MRAGVALRPETPVSVVLPLLRPRRLVHCVDVLAVQPGFGGQAFDAGVLAKVKELRSICPELDIQVCMYSMCFPSSLERFFLCLPGLGLNHGATAAVDWFLR